MITLKQAKRLKVNDTLLYYGKIYRVVNKPVKSFWHRNKVEVMLLLGKHKVMYVNESNLNDFTQIVIVKG